MDDVKAARLLERGDRIRLHNGLVRTVDRVTHSGYVNHRNESILSVWYHEGEQDGWGAGNTWASSSLVKLA